MNSQAVGRLAVVSNLIQRDRGEAGLKWVCSPINFCARHRAQVAILERLAHDEHVAETRVEAVFHSRIWNVDLHSPAEEFLPFGFGGVKPRLPILFAPLGQVRLIRLIRPDQPAFTALARCQCPRERHGLRRYRILSAAEPKE